MSNQKKFLKVGEVAERYSVGISTVWRWCRLGDFPKPTTIGRGATRWVVAELDKYDATTARASDAA